MYLYFTNVLYTNYQELPVKKVDDLLFIFFINKIDDTLCIQVQK